MKQKTQLSQLFQGMVMKCPLAINDYGKCLVMAKDRDSLHHHSCQKEFLELMKCFEKVSEE